MSAIRRHDHLYIDGEWRGPLGSDRIDVTSPWTEELVGSVPAASKDDIDLAVAAARKAFERGPWARLDPAERVEILRKVRNALAERRDEFASLVSTEMGSPITQSTSIQVGAPLALLDS